MIYHNYILNFHIFQLGFLLPLLLQFLSLFLLHFLFLSLLFQILSPFLFLFLSLFLFLPLSPFLFLFLLRILFLFLLQFLFLFLFRILVHFLLLHLDDDLDQIGSSFLFLFLVKVTARLIPTTTKITQKIIATRIHIFLRISLLSSPKNSLIKGWSSIC